jgi:hypothetical protein
MYELFHYHRYRVPAVPERCPIGGADLMEAVTPSHGLAAVSSPQGW